MYEHGARTSMKLLAESCGSAWAYQSTAYPARCSRQAIGIAETMSPRRPSWMTAARRGRGSPDIELPWVGMPGSQLTGAIGTPICGGSETDANAVCDEFMR